MTRHPNPKEIRERIASDWTEHPEQYEGFKRSYRQALANEIGKIINAPYLVCGRFPLDRLERALLVLIGEDDR